MSGPVMVNSRGAIPVQAERMKQIENRLSDLERQIATGDRLSSAADDPAGATRAAMLRRLDSRLVSEERSLERSSGRLSLAETAVEAAGLVVLRARDLGLAGASGTLSPEDRAVMAREVSQLRMQLLETANQRDEAGRYLFAGAQGAQPAYAADAAGQIGWRGFGTAAGVDAAGVSTAAVPRGPDLFGDDANGAFAALDALASALLEPDPLLRETGTATALERLEAAHHRLSGAQAVIGVGLARISTEQDRVAAARLDTAEALAAVRGVNLTSAIAELQALDLTLQAARASFSRIHDGSLFDRLG